MFEDSSSEKIEVDHEVCCGDVYHDFTYTAEKNIEIIVIVRPPTGSFNLSASIENPKSFAEEMLLLVISMISLVVLLGFEIWAIKAKMIKIILQCYVIPSYYLIF